MLEAVWQLFSASGFFRSERERLPETGSTPGAVAKGGEAGSDVHAHHLIGQQGDHAEHQMTEYFPTAAHPDMLRPELVLEAAEEALHRRAFPHARRFGRHMTRGAVGPPPAVKLRLELPVPPRVRLDQGNMAEAERAFADFPGVISAVHEIAETVRPFGPTSPPGAEPPGCHAARPM